MIVLGSMGRGGAERVISIISREYCRLGWEVSICMLLSNRVEYPIERGVELVDFSGNKESRIRRLPYWVRSLRSRIKESNPDVIVSFAARINVIVLLAAWGLKKRIIVSERNDPKLDGRGVATNVLTSILYPHSSAVVFQTKRVRDYFSKRIQRISYIIPNPIEIDRRAANSPCLKIVSVGRLTEQKNQKLLINAFGVVHQKYPQLELVIYGEGPLRSELETLADSIGLKDRVLLPGKVSDVHQKIEDALMFVLSSNYEGLSNALLEAMVMGLPCISTNCAGADEYIINEYNGLVTKTGDCFELAEAMSRFIEDSILRKNCAKNASKIESVVGLDAAMRQWREVIG